MTDSGPVTRSQLESVLLERLFSRIDEEFPDPPLRAKAPKDIVYHYTDARGLLGILEDAAIYATDYRFLNDRKEIVHGEQIITRVAQRMHAERKKGNQRAATQRSVDEQRFLGGFLENYRERRPSRKFSGVYVASFSAARNSLPQWQAYAAKGSGYALGFSAVDYAAHREHEAIAVGLVQCVYSDAALRSEAERLLTRVVKSYHVNYVTIMNDYRGEFRETAAERLYDHLMGIAHWQLGLLAPLHKHKDFKAEREWRLIAFPRYGVTPEKECTKFAATELGLKPYVSIPLAPEKRVSLAEVWIGPSQRHVHAEDAVRRYLAQRGYDGVKVKRSRTPYRG